MEKTVLHSSKPKKKIYHMVKTLAHYENTADCGTVFSVFIHTGLLCSEDNAVARGMRRCLKCKWPDEGRS